jgi:hypothetical protein
MKKFKDYLSEQEAKWAAEARAWHEESDRQFAEYLLEDEYFTDYIYEQNQQNPALDFFRHQKISARSNSSYIYVEAKAIPNMNFIQLKFFDQPHKLVAQNKELYTFEMNGTKQLYPKKDDINAVVFVVKSISNFHQLMDLVRVQFSGWRFNTLAIKPDQSITMVKV